MAFTNSPNMTLPIPSVGTEKGPNYAFDMNSCMTLIDQHDHSPGKGVQITPAGLNINSALNFQNTTPYNIGALTLTPQSSASSTSYTITAAPGGGTGINDLWYTDGTGTQIQITQNGIVKTTASSIPGESYAAGTFIWTQTQDSLPTTPANFDIGSITLRPIIASTTNGVTLNSSSTSDYDLTFMASLPSSQSFVTIDNFGSIATPVVYPLIASGIANGTITTTQISAAAGILGTQLADNTITATQIADNTITATQIANGTITTTQISAAAGIFPAQLTYSLGIGSITSFSVSTTTPTTVTGSTTTISPVTPNRPIFISFQGTIGGSGNGFITSTNGFKITIQAIIGVTAHDVASYVINSSASQICSLFNCIDTVFIAQTYRIQISNLTVSQTTTLTGITMIVMQV